MKIPENFKQKYKLKGESYPSANADAALSELFAVSGRLYKENADLKAEIAALREEVKNTPAPETAVSVDLSGIEALISSFSEQIASIRTTVNDTLCVVNDAAISAKKAEDSANEAKAASECASACAAEVKAKSQEILDAIEALGNKAEFAHDEDFPIIFTPESTENEDVEILGMIADPIIPFTENMFAESIDEPKEEEIVSSVEEETVAESDAVEDFADEPEEEVPAIEELAEEDEEIPEIPEAIPEEEPEKKEESDIADDLIRSAGLDSEPEEIEPAAPIDENDLTARLAKMYAETEDEELPIVNREEEEKEEAQPEPEKHAPTSFTDMKSALDAIRARLKK